MDEKRISCAHIRVIVHCDVIMMVDDGASLPALCVRNCFCCCHEYVWCCASIRQAVKDMLFWEIQRYNVLGCVWEGQQRWKNEGCLREGSKSRIWLEVFIGLFVCAEENSMVQKLCYGVSRSGVLNCLSN